MRACIGTSSLLTLKLWVLGLPLQDAAIQEVQRLFVFSSHDGGGKFAPGQVGHGAGQRVGEVSSWFWKCCGVPCYLI